MRGDWANPVEVGQSALMLEEWVDTGTSIADTVDSAWIAGAREVSLSIESPGKRECWDPRCWGEGL